MKKQLILILATTLFGLGVLSSCKNEIQLHDQVVKSKEASEQALILLQTNCFSCHQPDVETKNRAAPPMFKVKEHYIYPQTTRANFVNEMMAFVQEPTEEASKMPGALRHFGLMPKLSYKEEDLKAMVEYIYDNNLNSDSWYKEWQEFNKTEHTINKEVSYEYMGLNYANGTKAQLGKNLLAAIQELGTAGAVEFCNTKAIPLTDSMARVFNIAIKRVSDKPRNAMNAANEVELAYIQELKEALLNKQKTIPKLIESDGKIVGYYPIETNKMCLQCHGKKDNEILKETYQTIHKLYPADKAFGYGENEIRGLWVVEMNNK